MSAQPENELELRAKLFQKLAQVRESVGSIEKTGYNENQGYEFIEARTVYRAVRKALLEARLEFSISILGVEYENPDLNDPRKVHARTNFRMSLVDIDTGYVWEEPWAGEALDWQDKSLSKSETLGIKYFLIALLLIDPDEDPDSGPSRPMSRPRRYQPKSQGQGPSQLPEPLPDPGSYVVTFTKYAGKTLREIAESNKGFNRWVMDTIAPDNPTGDRAELVANVKAMLGMVDNPQVESSAAPGPQGEELTWANFWAKIMKGEVPGYVSQDHVWNTLREVYPDIDTRHPENTLTPDQAWAIVCNKAGV